jgi:hypothetical protein
VVFLLDHTSTKEILLLLPFTCALEYENNKSTIFRRKIMGQTPYPYYLKALLGRNVQDRKNKIYFMQY